MQIVQNKLAAMADAWLLQVNGLTKRYSARVGCAEVYFDLLANEVLGIVRKSGSGKSTLRSCLAGNLRPDQGQRIFDTAAGPRDTVTMTGTDRPRAFSGGMRQSLPIARNLVTGLRLMVIKDGHVVQQGLADQVLEGPQRAHTQLLAPSVLEV